jgi:hypothetical protein
VGALEPVDATLTVDCAKIRATVLEVYKAVRRRCREALVLFSFSLAPFKFSSSTETLAPVVAGRR